MTDRIPVAASPGDEVLRMGGAIAKHAPRTALRARAPQAAHTAHPDGNSGRQAGIRSAEPFVAVRPIHG